MSVILESQAGDELIVIEPFQASPEGESFAWETSRHFRVGERVRYLGFLQDQYYKDHPGLGWMVRFEVADSKQYTATQTYFVTEECWQGLKKFFARRLLHEPKSRKTPKP
jgi:hypothetical protein